MLQVGWIKFPSLMHLAWAAQWLQYDRELRANLTRPAHIITVFDDAVPTPATHHRFLLALGSMDI